MRYLTPLFACLQAMLFFGCESDIYLNNNCNLSVWEGTYFGWASCRNTPTEQTVTIFIRQSAEQSIDLSITQDNTGLTQFLEGVTFTGCILIYEAEQNGNFISVSGSLNEEDLSLTVTRNFGDTGTTCTYTASSD